MPISKPSHYVEGIEFLIESELRRRRTAQEKIAIVQETLEPGASMSAGVPDAMTAATVPCELKGGKPFDVLARQCSVASGGALPWVSFRTPLAEGGRTACRWRSRGLSGSCRWEA